MFESSAFILPVCSLIIVSAIVWLFWLRHGADR
jgi:hypothetical protein